MYVWNILHIIYISENVTLVCGNLHWKSNGKCLLCLINNAEYEFQMAKDDQETTEVRVHIMPNECNQLYCYSKVYCIVNLEM